MLEFQKFLGGATACTKRLVMATKACAQLISNDTSFAHIWFSVIKITEDAMDSGVDYCGLVKTSHKGFI